MELNVWTTRLRSLFDKALERYQSGWRNPDDFFDADERAFLASIGLKSIHLFDFAEDFLSAGEPDWETIVLIVAARRDYFLYHQHGEASVAEIDASELPSKKSELGGYPWLPRIIRKAQCFLDGGLCHNIMYCCAGDRNFLKNLGLHPADFLRAIWSTEGDDAKILAFVNEAASRQKSQAELGSAGKTAKASS